MKSTQEKLEEIKRKGYNLEFGDVFNDSIEIYKKVIWITGFAFFILTAAFLVLYFAIIALFFSTGDFINTMTEISLMENSVTFMVYTMLIAIVVSVGVSPMYAGVLEVCHNAKNNKEFDISTIFKHYKSSYLKEILISSLLIVITTSLIADALTLLGLAFLGTIITYTLQFITLFTIPFIIFGNLKAIPAIQASLTLLSKNFIVIFGLMLVAVIIAFIGIIALCIGILFTLPIIYTTQYAIYNTAVGVEEHDELDDIGRTDYY